MISEDLILSLLLRGGVILFVVWITDLFLLRRLGAGVARWTWMCAFALLLLSPICSQVQLWHLPGLPSLSTTEKISTLTPATLSSPSTDRSPPASNSAEPVAPLPILSQDPNRENLYISESFPFIEQQGSESASKASHGWLTLWLIGVVTIILYLLGGHFFLWRICRRAQPIDSKWRHDAKLVSSRLNLHRTPEILLSSDVTSPTVIGLIRPKVLIPHSVSQFESAHREVILLHEFTHIQGKDPLFNLLAQLAVVTHWLNPFAWLAFKALRFHQERNCDDASLRNGNDPTDYASLLVNVARSRPSYFPLTASLCLASKSTLGRRIQFILNQSIKRNTMTTKQKILIGFAALGILTPLALTGAEKAPLKEDAVVKIDQPTEAKNDRVKNELPAAENVPKNVVKDLADTLPNIKMNLKERFADVTSSVCLAQGGLEFIACTKDSKEHESIVTVQAKPSHIHTALLLLGAKAGHPAKHKIIGKGEKKRWIDIPPTGDPIAVSLVFKGKDGKQIEFPISHFVSLGDHESDEASAENKEAKKKLNTFLFAGSRLFGKGNGPKTYLADNSGHVIGLATFGDELLCLPGIFPEQIHPGHWVLNAKDLPKVGTEVILRLRLKAIK